MIGDRCWWGFVRVVWEMAFFMVLLGWSWGAGLWWVFAKSENILREGGVAVLVRDVDMDGAGLSGKGGCGRLVYSLRAF